MTVTDIVNQYAACAGNMLEHNPYLTPSELESLNKPRVLIVGGGIGGLTLAILLKKAGIPFQVYERAIRVQETGSALIFGPNVAPLFEQMGIYDELHYQAYVIPRPEFYDLLWRNIPRENIHLDKNVISTQQNTAGVTIRCDDLTTFHGDILVGADGAFSTVRQQMFRDMKIRGVLPPSDEKSTAAFSCACLVGQTRVLRPDVLPGLQAEGAQSYVILGVRNLCVWATYTTKKNTVCWMVYRFAEKTPSGSNESSEGPKKRTSNDSKRAPAAPPSSTPLSSWRPSESNTVSWGEEAAQQMCHEVRGLKVPGGREGFELTIGDFIENTPKQCLGKTTLEDIVYDTWHDGRTVLLGDACHKVNPTHGDAATLAIHDAAALANWISTLKTPSLSDLDKAFQEYKAERQSAAKHSYDHSQRVVKKLGKWYEV
ncbi:hypothetical protein BGZ94_002536 [Podila epigama]|nr:hypothetical protein BGZ94_002536 [Podila epigama]